MSSINIDNIASSASQSSMMGDYWMPASIGTPLYPDAWPNARRITTPSYQIKNDYKTYTVGKDKTLYVIPAEGIAEGTVKVTWDNKTLIVTGACNFETGLFNPEETPIYSWMPNHLRKSIILGVGTEILGAELKNGAVRILVKLKGEDPAIEIPLKR